ncbi:dynamin family protein [Staphylococcus lutrae]|uniref:Dynamin family protein n=1 Tax=Staphylococcus lutrae TaxID=155085 RepID=A0AAC9WMY3_9STAP|nr:dynamin family protein [Staphylococcus lutrae]ARJ51857.1 dynamin family protein [Staphylococcus lutrae]PNZ36098.1 GTP-binding protein [Staphylococcus lutrae]
MHNEKQLDILYKLKKEVEKSDHAALIHTINQMIKKVYLNQYTMSFVGHFSAGKSTVINRLIGEDILPSSPVPTTSNTALVTIAEETGITANIVGQRYTHLDNYEAVKEMNRQNYDVESIDIRIQSDIFHDGFTFQDTPGVDSNVQSHSMQTEQFLYTSNIVFYTVDYHHVQSELNFKFMKRLNQTGVPVVFIINQIDKHDETEIHFETFQKRVQQSITDWDIELLATFYITKFDHPANQFDELRAFMIRQDQNRESIDVYVDRMKRFIQQHQLDYLQHEMDDILEQLNVEAAQFDRAYQVQQQNEVLSEEAQLLNDASALKRYLKDKRLSIIDNAYIMTHDMREYIRFYLESMTKDFKVGGLFNKKKKTAEERQTRLNTLREALQDKVDHQIGKPMQDDLSFLTRFINDSSLNKRILNHQIVLPTELITSSYQTQIQITNQYVLTYSQALMKAIKQFILKETAPLDESIIHKVHADEHLVDESNDDSLFTRFVTLRELQHSLKTENYRHYYIHMEDSLDRLIDRTEIQFQPKNHTRAIQTDQKQQADVLDTGTTHAVSQLSKALDIVKKIPLFQSTVQDIEDTLTRMQNQKIKIGVFGTFSAGKSSLINAMLGGMYLTSSPNPTTAATTEITYGDTHFITFKTPETLLQEINHIFELEGLHFDRIETFLESDTTRIKSKIEKSHLALIQAIEKHYPLYQSYIAKGFQHDIQVEDIQKWSANDEFATFVQTVHLRLPMDWLKDKIIIDSLGLHSNNQRHTNETEKILTRSDLIVYVSYFNHAFTDNDKSFITHMKAMNQLKTNQVFKMVINATDLAENEKEKTAVYQYVTDALKQLQLEPEIFDVSSRLALTKGHDDGIAQLKASINHFSEVASKHLLELKIYDQFRFIQQSYNEMIHNHISNAEKIERNQHALRQMRQKALFNPQQLDTIQQKIINEIEDQMYHLNERLKIQLLDDVKAVYNSQMTNTSNFNEEIRLSTKIFLNQIQQKLYLEQTLLMERIKYYFNQALQQETAPKIKSFQQYHILLPEIEPVDVANVETPYLNLALEEMLNGLPKQLTKKNILQPHVQKQIQSMIKDETIALLQPKLADLRYALEEMLTKLTAGALEKLEQIESIARHEIDTTLAVKIDAPLIQQLQNETPKLTRLLKLKD